MLKPPSADLPLEQRQRLPADFIANEQSYLRIRDGLMSKYRGKWVAVKDGVVVVSGDDLLTVMDEAAAAGGHPYVAKVGEEDEFVVRVRRAQFAYDQSYAPFALPCATVTFWDYHERRSQTYSDVIPDTGADLTTLPDSDCAAFDRFGSPFAVGRSRGVIGASVRTVLYRGRAEINGRRVAALIEPIQGIRERLVGRDVLNQHRVLFGGPAGLIIFDP
jgi:hypothetical protein